MSRRAWWEVRCTVDVLPSDGGHAVRFHRLSDGDNLGGVADVVIGIWMWLERLSAVAVCAPGVPSWRSEQSSSTGMAGRSDSQPGIQRTAARLT